MTGNPRRLELVIANGIEPLSIGHTISAEAEGNGISGWVAATGRSYICRDCSDDPRYMGGLEGARSSLTTPLRLHDRVIGVLNVESDKIEQFDDEGRLLLELYGRYVAMAVNILDMLIVERYTTNRRLSNNVITELEDPGSRDREPMPRSFSRPTWVMPAWSRALTGSWNPSHRCELACAAAPQAPRRSLARKESFTRRNSNRSSVEGMSWSRMTNR